MTAPNHITGGYVLTGLVCAFSGFSLFDDLILCTSVFVFSLLADIDHPSSTLGRLFKGVSRPLYRYHGHRTITHSLLSIVVIYLLVKLIEIYLGLVHLAYVSAIAHSVHILLDMVTVSGVQLMYPFSRSIYVMPASPRYRISVRDFRQELVAFSFFILLLAYSHDLMTQGFWTTYNSALGTQKHLYSEFVKSDGLLLAEYELKLGSNRYTVNGYVLKCNQDGSILSTDAGPRSVPDRDEIVLSVTANKTDKRLIYEYAIAHEYCDSRLMDENLVAALDVHAVCLKDDKQVYLDLGDLKALEGICDSVVQYTADLVFIY